MVWAVFVGVAVSLMVVYDILAGFCLFSGFFGKIGGNSDRPDPYFFDGQSEPLLLSRSLDKSFFRC